MGSQTEGGGAYLSGEGVRSAGRVQNLLVEPGSIFTEMGLRMGDVIRRINEEGGQTWIIDYIFRCIFLSITFALY